MSESKRGKSRKEKLPAYAQMDEESDALPRSPRASAVAAGDAAVTLTKLPSLSRIGMESSNSAIGSGRASARLSAREVQAAARKLEKKGSMMLTKQGSFVRLFNPPPRLADVGRSVRFCRSENDLFQGQHGSHSAQFAQRSADDNDLHLVSDPARYGQAGAGHHGHHRHASAISFQEQELDIEEDIQIGPSLNGVKGPGHHGHDGSGAAVGLGGRDAAATSNSEGGSGGGGGGGGGKIPLHRDYPKTISGTQLSAAVRAQLTAPKHQPLKLQNQSEWADPLRKLEAKRIQFRLLFVRVAVATMIGIAVGLTAYVCISVITSILPAVNDFINDLSAKDYQATAMFTYFGINLSMALACATLVLFVSFNTRGAGGGKLSAYMTGFATNRFLTLRSLVVKTVGTILTVCGGLRQGLEGPFLYIGACWGLLVTTYFSWFLKWIGGKWGNKSVFKKSNWYATMISSQKDQRVFVSCGAAAGFAAAFNAPIAGALYVHTGNAALLTGEFTFLVFVCSLVSVFMFNFCFVDGQGYLPSRGIIEINRPSSQKVNVGEFIAAIFLGIMGGIGSALFTKFNVYIDHLRHHHISYNKLKNYIDVILTTMAVSFVAFALPFMMPCQPKEGSVLCKVDCVEFNCPEGKFNDLASLLFITPQDAIKTLFDRTIQTDDLSQVSVLIFGFFIFLFVGYGYNMAVPGGLMVPSILIGGAWGRPIGVAMVKIFPNANFNAGVYSVMGAAAFLGGLSRFTVPITVLFVELTSDNQYLLPVALCVLIAKTIADWITPGLYMQHLKLEGQVMIFHQDMPSKLSNLTAMDLMSPPPLRTINVVDKVATLWRHITKTGHNAFPIVYEIATSVHAVEDLAAGRTPSGVKTLVHRQSSRSDSVSLMHKRQVFVGLVSRKEIVALLKQGKTYNSREEAWKENKDHFPSLEKVQLARAKGQSDDKEPSYGSSSLSSGAELRHRGPRPPVGGSLQRQRSADHDESNFRITAETFIPPSVTLGAPDRTFPATSAGDAVPRLSPSTFLPPDQSLADAPAPPAMPRISSDTFVPPPEMQQEAASANHDDTKAPATAPGSTGALEAGSASADVTLDVVDTSSQQATSSPKVSGMRVRDVESPRLRPGAGVGDLPVAPGPRFLSETVTAQLSPRVTRKGSGGVGLGADLKDAFSPAAARPRKQSPPAEHSEYDATVRYVDVPPDALRKFVHLWSNPKLCNPDTGCYIVHPNTNARRVWQLLRNIAMRHIVVINEQHEPLGIITRNDVLRAALE